MHIAIDATCWGNQRGYGRHARSLLSALVRVDRRNEYTFFFDSAQASANAPDGCRAIVVENSMPTIAAASATGRRSALDMWAMSAALSRSHCDLLLFPTVYSYVPIVSRARKLVMIHDVIAETFPALTLPRTTARWFWNMKVALGRWQADALITVSDYSRERIVERFRMSPERVFVVGEASDPAFRLLDNPQPTPKLKDAGITAGMPFIAYLGGFNPHKNLEALVHAFSRIVARPELADVKLVMAGETRNEAFHSYLGTITALVERLGLRDRVIFTGFVPDQDLVVLLNLARVLALPSLMEGFGLPAVEAAACGCPIVATAASPLPSLLGDGGIFIDPQNGNLQQALERVLLSEALRRRMREAGLAAARRLSWEAAAESMLGVFEKVSAQ